MTPLKVMEKHHNIFIDGTLKKVQTVVISNRTMKKRTHEFFIFTSIFALKEEIDYTNKYF